MIEVEDDGRGIDPEKIKDAMIKKKIASKKEVESMNVTEILDHLFHPGFSTKDVASEISGRGVGLDVVAAQLQRLKGDIRINSTPDKGTAFSIRVPLTLAIAQAMLIKLGDETLAVPLTSVEETIQFDESEIQEKGNKKFLQIRDKVVPLVSLSDFLDYRKEKKEIKPKNFTAIVIQESGSNYAFIVDKVLRREEIVIKSLGEELSRIPYLSGGTIFGDGSVALILDIPAIIKKVEMDFSRFYPERTEKTHPAEVMVEEEAIPTKLMPRKEVTGRLPIALIIDDSLSVRKFVSSVLERNNYATVLASDGPEALSILEKEKFDIIITDLEMPKMHGFELIEKIREQEKYNALPIVILTGRVGKEHKDKGMQLGANSYIVKPFKENDLVKTLENFIDYTKE
jgi:CheY-like chemotaxis protein